MKQKIFFIVIAHFSLLFLSPTLFACSNKSCENNYLVSAHKYKNKSFHQATTSQKEKAQYSANYKRQQIALVNVRRAHALNQARRRYASNSNINLTHQKISVVNEHRAHALNRARKGYALSHLKKRRQVLLNHKKQKTFPVNQQGIEYDLNNFARKYQKLAKAQVRKPRYSKRNKAVSLKNRNIKKPIRSASREKARKARAAKERQRLANLKIRRADALEREKREYAKYKQRRNLAIISKRVKSEKTI